MEMGTLSGPIVPGNNLKAQYRSIKTDIDIAIQRVLDNGEFDRGVEVDRLEEAIAGFCGTRYAVGVGSGYAALFLALKACDIGPGDEVITVANTDLATVSAISHTGATPVFVDIDPLTYNIAPELISRALTSRTRALLPVHMYGLPADMDPILDIASGRGLLVIEDAAIAQGARYKGKRVGGIGHLGCLSFAPRKILGSYGDGGMVITDNPEWAARIRLYGSYGERVRSKQVGEIRLSEWRDHEVQGYHSHLGSLQAAVLNAKLTHLERWISRRQAIAAAYDARLSELGVTPPHVPDGHEHVYRNYVICVENRDAVRRTLAEKGVHTDILYVPPIHLQTVFAKEGYRPGDLPATEKAAGQLFCLPMYPDLTDEQVEYVLKMMEDAIREAPQST